MRPRRRRRASWTMTTRASRFFIGLLPPGWRQARGVPGRTGSRSPGRRARATTNSQAPWMIWANTAKLWNVVKTTRPTVASAVSRQLSRRMPRTATPTATTTYTATLTAACSPVDEGEDARGRRRRPREPSGRRPRGPRALRAARAGRGRGRARSPRRRPGRPAAAPATSQAFHAKSVAVTKGSAAAKSAGQGQHRRPPRATTGPNRRRPRSCRAPTETAATATTASARTAAKRRGRVPQDLPHEPGDQRSGCRPAADRARARRTRGRGRRRAHSPTSEWLEGRHLQRLGGLEHDGTEGEGGQQPDRADHLGGRSAAARAWSTSPPTSSASQIEATSEEAAGAGAAGRGWRRPARSGRRRRRRRRGRAAAGPREKRRVAW